MNNLSMIGTGHICNLGKLPERANVLDLGASIGQFLTALKEERPLARCLSVEADPNNIKRLEDRISGFNDCTCIHSAVIGEDIGETTFFHVPNRPQWGSTKKRHDHVQLVEINIPAITMHDIFNRSNETFDYVKMDIEGMELEVLLSCTRAIFKRINQISIEIHEQCELPIIDGILKDNGFKTSVHTYQNETELFGEK